jgi:hypothetical protein
MRAKASSRSILTEDLKEFPDLSMTVTVLRPSEKSWAMTANANIIPTWGKQYVNLL